MINKQQKWDSLSDVAKKNEFLKNGILPKWHNKKLSDYKNDPQAKESIDKYLKSRDNMLKKGVGLYLWGANGTGKTHLMMTSFKELRALDYSVKVISLSSLIAKFTAGWYDMAEKRELQNALQRVDFLGIEEIGKEFRSQNSDLGTVVLDNVLRYRVQMMKPTWFTSNVPPGKLTANYTEDIASMLKECSYPIQVMGKDMRGEQYNKIKEFFENDLDELL